MHAKEGHEKTGTEFSRFVAEVIRESARSLGIPEAILCEDARHDYLYGVETGEEISLRRRQPDFSKASVQNVRAESFGACVPSRMDLEFYRRRFGFD